MTEAIRTFRQYIELNVAFDNEQKAREVWPVLYENDIGLKGYEHSKFHFNNFTGQSTKKVVSVTSLLCDEPYQMDSWPPGNTALLNRLIGVGNWSRETITIPNYATREFVPAQFAIRERVFTGTDLSSWFSSDIEDGVEFYHDLRFRKGEQSANIYSMTISRKRGGPSGFISGLVFKVQISSQDQTLLDGCEDLVNDLILNTIVKACQEVGPITHSLSCKGEIEVEKAVSCNRFSVTVDDSQEEEE